MSQAKLRIHRNRDASPGCGHKSQRAVRKLWMEALETRLLLSTTLLDEPQLPDAPGQAGQHGRLPADVLEWAPWVAGLGWQLSKDLFTVPDDLSSDAELRAATPPAARATPARGGSKSVAAANGSPTGLTIAPTGASQSIWIVDVSKDRVYEYANARSRTSGSQTAGVSFALASGNTSPQDIADPDGSLRALSAAAAPAGDGAMTAADAWETPIAARQAVAFETRRADSPLAHGSVLSVFASQLRHIAPTRPDRGEELVAVVKQAHAPERESRDVLAVLAAESRSGWQSDADRLFAGFDWSSSFDAPT